MVVMRSSTSNDNMCIILDWAPMAHTITWSFFIFPPSGEEIACPYDGCGEEFFLDQRFANYTGLTNQYFPKYEIEAVIFFAEDLFFVSS